jgi:hypothetical protein
MSLDKIISALVSKGKRSVIALRNGASLAFSPDPRPRLTVWRDGQDIDAAELRTFEKYIRLAGYTPAKVETWEEGARRLARWDIKPKPAKDAADQAMQPDLFTMTDDNGTRVEIQAPTALDEVLTW